MSAEKCEQEIKLNPQTPTSTSDVIKEIIGDFGKWQLKISILMALIKFPIAWFQMSIVFLAPPTNFWCQNINQYQNLSEDKWRELSRPKNDFLMQKGINEGYCFIKQLVNQSLNSTNINEKLVPCPAFNYNNSIFTSTITSEWNLICDRQKLMDISQVSLMFGVLLGNVMFGVLADKKGRKKILILCLFLQSFFGIFASISPFFWLFVILRFFLALANGGTMVTSFVICIETVGGKWRTIIPILYQIPFAVGYSLLAIIAYFIRNWRDLHLTISLISMLYISMHWLISESPRWLLAIGKKKEALIILKKAAKQNGFVETNTNLIESSCKIDNDSNNKMRGLFSTRELRKRSYLLCVNWTIAGATFFAFIQHMGHVSQNLFLTVVLGGLISVPGTIIAVILVNNYGRRSTIVASFLLTALCSFLILMFPKGLYILDWPRMTLVGIGTIGLSISIPTMYLFTGELYPTVLRNSGVGLIMMFSRLGSMIAPLIISLQSVAEFLPLLLIGIATIVQGILILPLPETHEKPLPDTIADLRNGRIRKCQQGAAINLEH